MSKAYVLNPLAVLGARAGYTRKLDKHDFPHGEIPGWARNTIPGVGELKRFANLTNFAGADGIGTDTNTWTTDQQHPLGTLASDKIQRVWRYVRAGAADLVAGNAIQSSAVVTQHFALTSAAQAIGDGTGAKPIVVTPGSTAAAANYYAEGLLFVTVTPGLGKSHRISGHGAITASTAFNMYLDPDDLLTVAFTSSTRYGLMASPYRDVIQFPVTTATGTLVGVAGAPIVAVNYGWVQTKGEASALIAGTPALGAMVMSPGTTAGASVVVTTTNLVVAQFLGKISKIGVDGECAPVFLMID